MYGVITVADFLVRTKGINARYAAEVLARSFNKISFNGLFLAGHVEEIFAPDGNIARAFRGFAEQPDSMILATRSVVGQAVLPVEVILLLLFEGQIPEVVAGFLKEGTDVPTFNRVLREELAKRDLHLDERINIALSIFRPGKEGEGKTSGDVPEGASP